METSGISQAPVLAPLSLSHLCAKYLKIQFQSKLNARLSSATTTPLAQPLMLPVALASELDIIAATLVDAFLNRRRYNNKYILTLLIIYSQKWLGGMPHVMRFWCRTTRQGQEQRLQMRGRPC